MNDTPAPRSHAWQQSTRPALPEAVATIFDESTAEIWHGEQPA